MDREEQKILFWFQVTIPRSIYLRKIRRFTRMVYKDKGYSGVKSRGYRGYDATMKRAVRGHPLDIKDKLRNKRISRKRGVNQSSPKRIERIEQRYPMFIRCSAGLHLT